MRKLAAFAFALSSLALFAERDMAIYRGKLTSDLNANGNRITSVDLPLDAGDAANKEYVDAHGGGIDTNAVDILANSAVVTNALTVATTNRVAALETATGNLSSSVSSLASSKADKTTPYAAGNLAALTADGNLMDSGIAKTNVATKAETDAKLAGKRDKDDLDVNEFGEHSVLAPECFPIIATGVDFSSYSIKDTPYGLTLCDAEGNERANFDRYDGKFYNSEPGLDISFGGLSPVAGSFPYLLPDTLAKVSQLSTKADIMMISATNPTFSNAVLAVGLNIDTNSVAVLNEIADTFGGFPIEGTATTVGGLLAALAAAAAWLKKNKVGSFASVGGATATVDNGVAKLDDFFTNSNSLLNGRLAYERNETGLKDRAFNTLSFDGTEYNLSTVLEAVTPTASGQPRDLLIVATATAATTISYTAGTIKGDKPTIDGSGTWLITLTEYSSGVWYCRQIKMEDAA